VRLSFTNVECTGVSGVGEGGAGRSGRVEEGTPAAEEDFDSPSR